jgi:hypothetical protein
LVENLPHGLYLLSAGFLATAEPVDEPHLELVQQTDSAYLYEAQGNLPRIYVASGVEVVDSHEAALAAATVAASAPYTQAVVTVLESDEMGEGEIAVRGPAGQAAEFTAEYSAYETNSLTAEVTTERAGIVVFSEMYYPGWEAVVDGQPARVWRANYAFRGVMVEAGTHVIRMDYRPASFRIGLVISGVTLLVIAGISAVKGAGFLVRRR